MRYGKVDGVLYGTNTSGLLQSFRDTFSTIPGWEMWDDQTTAATPYVVFKTTTSEGVGNEFYTKFQHVNTDYMRVDIYEAWNNATHAGSGNHSGGGRIEHNNGTRNNFLTYYYCGDQDHILFYIDVKGDSIHMPTYIGLTTKMQPDHDGPRGVVMLTWHHIDGHTGGDNEAYSFSDYNKVPILRGSDGVHEKITKLFGTSPNFENVNITGYIPGGPYSLTPVGEPQRRAMYWYPMVLVEKNGIGPRGILKNVLYAGSTYYSNLGRYQKVQIGSRDYILVRMTSSYGDDTASNRNPWGTWYSHGGFMHSYVIPTSDWYIPCFIEGN